VSESARDLFKAIDGDIESAMAFPRMVMVEQLVAGGRHPDSRNEHRMKAIFRHVQILEGSSVLYHYDLRFTGCDA
jgi:hypothetical protein